MDGHIQGGIQRTEDRHEVGTEMLVNGAEVPHPGN